jgi:hypothetical protein
MRLTPKLFNLLCDRKHSNDRRELTNSALITATIINVNRTKKQRAIKIEDIIGSEKKQSNDQEVDLLTFMKGLATKNKKR